MAGGWESERKHQLQGDGGRDDRGEPAGVLTRGRVGSGWMNGDSGGRGSSRGERSPEGTSCCFSASERKDASPAAGTARLPLAPSNWLQAVNFRSTH